MSMKSANFFEQHVEKIVMAVAAAGALYMGFLATKPITIPGPSGAEVSADHVEDEVAAAVSAMDASRKANEQREPPNIPIVDYAADYKKLAQGEPLPQGLLTSITPQFGPKGVPLGGIEMDDPLKKSMAVVTPTPVEPEGMTATAIPLLVASVPATAAPGMPVQPLPAGTTLPTHDQNAVAIQGFIPVGKMLMDIIGQTDPKARLLPAYQRIAIAKIQVERRERTPSGFTEWSEITPSKGSSPPTEIPWPTVQAEEIPSRLAQVDGEYNLIGLPSFYVDAKGVPIPPPIMTQPLPAQIDREVTNLTDQIAKARTSGTSGVTGPGSSGPGMAVNPYILPAPAAAAGATQLDMNRLKETVVPFCVWDENVLADHQYQYRVTVQYVNPTYQWQYGLKNPAMAKEPLLTAKAVAIPTPVKVHSDLVFFVTGGGNLVAGTGDHTASFKVFKKTSGKWYFNEFVSQPGMGIGGRIALIDKVPREQIDVDTGYTVVDVQQSNAGVHVVLRDAEGNLVPRDSNVDGRSPELRSLEADAAKPPAPVAAAPGTDNPGSSGPQSINPAGPNYVPPTTPRGTPTGRSTTAAPRPTPAPRGSPTPAPTPGPTSTSPPPGYTPRTAN